MKSIYKISLLAALAMSAAACTIDEIKPYQLENSAVVFKSKSNPFSLRGVMDSTIVVEIPVELIGVMTEYDREINVSVLEDSTNTAVEGRDFRIVYKTLERDTYEGVIRLEVKNLSDTVETLCTTLQIRANDNFIDGVPSESRTFVEWSKSYVRPEEGVWYSWYWMFGTYYSKAYHELLLNICGDEVEHSTRRRSYTYDNPDLVWRLDTWWNAKYGLLKEEVRKHDEANPDDPYMHSDDVKKYSSVNEPADEGETPETLPTILETLTR